MHLTQCNRLINAIQRKKLEYSVHPLFSPILHVLGENGICNIIDGRYLFHNDEAWAREAKLDES